MSASSQQVRNIGLDALRALAVVIVLANHCYLGLLVSTGNAGWEGINKYLSASAIISIEWLFVLSGYLIGAIMIRSLERKGASLQGCWDFWLRRWFRTVPCYYLFLIVNIILSKLIQDTGSFEISYLFFSQNLFYPETAPHFYGESWSLAMDEWFYLIMPLLIYGMIKALRLSLKDAFYLSSCILILYPTVARLMAHVPENFWAWDSQVRRITFFHLDATGWGVLAAAVNRWNPIFWSSRIKLKALLGIGSSLLGLSWIWTLLYSGWSQEFLYSCLNAFSISLMGVGTLLALPLITQIRISSSPAIVFISFVSTYSYTLYLSHFPFIFIYRAAFDLASHTPKSEVVAACFVWLVSVVAVSMVVYKFFEKPISDLREQFTTRVNTAPFAVGLIK